MAEGRKPFVIQRSAEEAADLMKAILGFSTVVSNVNLPNRGQMGQLPLGTVVETNCVFSNGQVRPVTARPLPGAVASLVHRNAMAIETAYAGIKDRDLGVIFQAFADQPLCGSLTLAQAEELFRQMCRNTREYLEPYFDLSRL